MFVACCKREGAEVTQTYFEADREMAALAKSLGCPLVSCDSDFFVNDIDFLPFDLVEWDAVEDADADGDGDLRYVRCKKFDRVLFLRRHGVSDPRMLPLMSAVLGNDYVPLQTFSMFFAQVKMPPRSRAVGQRQRTINGFLRWLGRERSCEAAVEKVMETIPRERRDGLKEKISDSMAMYHGEAESVRGQNGAEEAPLLPQMLDRSGQVPEWFLSEYHRGKFPSWSLDVACNGKLYLQSQVEDANSRCSHLFAEEIVKSTLSLLLGMGRRSGPQQITLHTREGLAVRRVDLQIDWAAGDDGTSLEVLRTTSKEERFRFICGLVKLPREQEELAQAVPCSSQLLMCAVHWWTSRERVTRVELDALSFCLAVEQMLAGPGTFSVDSARPELPDETRCAVRSRMVRYRSLSSALQGAGVKRVADLSFIRKLSDLQATLYHLAHLARLLDLPELAPDVADFWDGTFLFNVHNDLLTFGAQDNRRHAMLDFVEGATDVVDSVTKLVDLFSAKVASPPQARKKRTGRKGGADANVKLQELSNRFSLLEL